MNFLRHISFVRQRLQRKRSRGSCWSKQDINWLKKPKIENLLRLAETCQEEITISQLEEKHHRYYGRPWILGRVYFDQLIDLGLKVDDEVLEVGCGAGRLGARLINYLENGKYYGIDNDIEGLNAFNNYEVVYWGCEEKRYGLFLDSDFRFTDQGVKMKWIIDLWVSAHLSDSQKELMASMIDNICDSETRILVSPSYAMHEVLRKHKHVLIETVRVKPKYLNKLEKEKQVIEIGIYKKSDCG